MAVGVFTLDQGRDCLDIFPSRGEHTKIPIIPFSRCFRQTRRLVESRASSSGKDTTKHWSLRDTYPLYPLLRRFIRLST